MAKLVNGKVSVSDRDKYREMSTESTAITSIPELLQKAFDEADLSAKWVAKRRLQEGGGKHRSGWIPYQMSDEQVETLPKLFVGTIVGNCLERGDLVLSVKPMEAHQQHVRRIKERTEIQLESFFDENDENNPVKMKRERQS